ncbi:hypothetical protein D3C86_1834120 [compost metagenome]
MSLLQGIDRAGGGNHDALAQGQHIAVSIVDLHGILLFGCGSRPVPGTTGPDYASEKTRCLSQIKKRGKRDSGWRASRARWQEGLVEALLPVAGHAGRLCFSSPQARTGKGMGYSGAARLTAFNQPGSQYES